MTSRLAITVGLVALLGARVAVAQEASIGYQGLPIKATGESATGINVAEGMLLHVGAGTEVGYDSNVFYANSGLVSSGVIRSTAYAELTNASRTGGAPSNLSFDVRGGMTYRHYTSSDPSISPYANAFMPLAGLSLGYGGNRVSVQLSDSFLRLEDPPYAASTSSPLTRDSNLASVDLRVAPGGGRISTILRYSNTIDVFESTQFSYASAVTHRLMLDVSWKWLPKTAFFFQVEQAYTTYLSQNTKGKVDSFPLHAILGLRGLITPKTSVNLSLGYANFFSSSGASSSGILGSTYFQGQVTINPTMMSRVLAGYKHDFANSVISSFYYEDAVFASYVQQLGGRLSLDLSGRLSHRNYQGLLFDMTTPNPTRTDNLLNLGATLDYFVRNWIYAGVGYAFLANLSDYQTPAGGTGLGAHPVQYSKHQVFARLGLTY